MPYDSPALMESVPIGVVLLNESFAIQHINKIALVNFGLTIDTCTNKQVDHLFQTAVDTEGKKLLPQNGAVDFLIAKMQSNEGLSFGVIKPTSDRMFLHARLLKTAKGWAISLENITSDVLLSETLAFHHRLQDLMFYTMQQYFRFSPEEALQHISSSLQMVGDFIGIDKLYVFRYNSDCTMQQVVHEWHSPDINMDFLPTVALPTTQFQELLQLNIKGESYYVEDFNQLPDNTATKEVMRRHGALSSLTIPIMRRGVCIGYLGTVFVKKVHTFSENERTLLNVLTEILGYALDPLAHVDAKRMLGMVNSQTNYVIRINTAGKHTFWNEKFEKDFGWMYSESGIAEGDAMSSICEYDRDKVAGVVFQCTANPGEIRKVEIDKPARDGGIMSTLWEFVCLTDDNGTPTEVQCVGMDVTETVKVQRKLEESEKKYRVLFERSPVPYLVMVDHKFIECNVAALELTGYTKEELIGLTPVDISPALQPNGMPTMEYAMMQIQKAFSNVGHAFECVHTRKDGSEFTAMASITVSDYEGKPALFVTWRDVSALRTIQNELELKERRYREVAEHSHTVVWETNLEGMFTYASSILKEIYGYTPEELVGKKKILDLFPEGTTQRYIDQGLEMIRKTGKMQGSIVPIVRIDGKIIWVTRNSSLLYDANGVHIGYRGSDNDITERRNAEQELEKFRIISDQASHGTAIADLAGNITYVNDAWAAQHGYSVGELIGKSLSVFHPESELPKVMDSVREIQVTGGFANLEIIHMRKDGSTYPTLMSGRLVRDQNNVPLFMTSNAIDISEQKANEKKINDINQLLEIKVEERTRELQDSNVQLINAKEEADKANHAKSEFLSRMSHELRTPMNSILGFAQLLEMDNLGERQHRNVKQILSSGNHLLDLINEVLDIARIESGHLSLSMEPVDVIPVINECVSLLQPLAALRNITISAIACDNEECFVQTDRQRIKQVLLNLMNNAIKYNVENGKVTVRTQTIRNEGNKLRISVVDTGKGINPKYMDHIFTPFERIGVESTGIEGTGLGLSVVRQLMNLMGGNVGVESILGSGSIFWVELSECDSRLSEIENNLNSNSTGKKESTFKGTILYIEDNSSNVQLIEHILKAKRENIHLITSPIGTNAVDLAQEHKPSLLLLDLNLPDMHGAEVLRILKNTPETSQIPVIVLSADALPEQIETLINLGAVDYITKPIDITNFLSQIDKYTH